MSVKYDWYVMEITDDQTGQVTTCRYDPYSLSHKGKIQWLFRHPDGKESRSEFEAGEDPMPVLAAVLGFDKMDPTDRQYVTGWIEGKTAKSE